MTGRPIAQTQQRLALLGTTGPAAGQQSQRRFLIWLQKAFQTNRQTEGAAIAEAHQGLESAAEQPGLSCQQPQLLTQGQFPAGGMGPSRCSEAADRAGAVMAGGRTTIGAGQHKNSVRGEDLQDWLDQSTGMAKGVQINQVKPSPLELGLTQQRLGRNTAAGGPCHWLEVVLQQGPSIAIGIVHNDLRWHRMSPSCLQPPTQPPDAASRHQIQPLEGVLTGCCAGLMPGQQHRAIPGRP